PVGPRRVAELDDERDGPLRAAVGAVLHGHLLDLTEAVEIDLHPRTLFLVRMEEQPTGLTITHLPRVAEAPGAAAGVEAEVGPGAPSPQRGRREAAEHHDPERRQREAETALRAEEAAPSAGAFDQLGGEALGVQQVRERGRIAAGDGPRERFGALAAAR